MRGVISCPARAFSSRIAVASHALIAVRVTVVTRGALAAIVTLRTVRSPLVAIRITVSIAIGVTLATVRTVTVITLVTVIAITLGAFVTLRTTTIGIAFVTVAIALTAFAAVIAVTTVILTAIRVSESLTVFGTTLIPILLEFS